MLSAEHVRDLADPRAVAVRQRGAEIDRHAAEVRLLFAQLPREYADCLAALQSPSSAGVFISSAEGHQLHAPRAELAQLAAPISSASARDPTYQPAVERVGGLVHQIAAVLRPLIERSERDAHVAARTGYQEVQLEALRGVRAADADVRAGGGGSSGILGVLSQLLVLSCNRM